IQVHFAAGVLAEQDPVAGLHVERANAAVLEQLAGADRHHAPLLGLLLGGIRDDDAALRGGLLLDALDQDAVVQGSDLHGSRLSFGSGPQRRPRAGLRSQRPEIGRRPGAARTPASISTPRRPSSGPRRSPSGVQGRPENGRLPTGPAASGGSRARSTRVTRDPPGDGVAVAGAAP